MVPRPYWLQRIEQAWREAPIAWLCGVRRCGKTTLAESLGEERALYVNCDLPAVEDMVRDPRLFFRSCSRPVVVFDEIHQLRDPTRLLKVGADAFPKLKILATGSSTLAASRKFRDTLTGRKINLTSQLNRLYQQTADLEEQIDVVQFDVTINRSHPIYPNQESQKWEMAWEELKDTYTDTLIGLTAFFGIFLLWTIRLAVYLLILIVVLRGLWKFAKLLLSKW